MATDVLEIDVGIFCNKSAPDDVPSVAKRLLKTSLASPVLGNVTRRLATGRDRHQAFLCTRIASAQCAARRCSTTSAAKQKKIDNSAATIEQKLAAAQHRRGAKLGAVREKAQKTVQHHEAVVARLQQQRNDAKLALEEKLEAAKARREGAWKAKAEAAAARFAKVQNTRENSFRELKENLEERLARGAQRKILSLASIEARAIMATVRGKRVILRQQAKKSLIMENIITVSHPPGHY
jgi:hypothetical protein